MEKLEIKKFEGMLEGALTKFDKIGDEHAVLREDMAELRGRIDAVLGDSRRADFGKRNVHRGVEIPWESQKQAETFVDWCRAVLTKNFSAIEKADLGEDTDATGGFLVPTEFRPTLLRIIEQFGLARQICTIFPVGRDEVQLPVLDGYRRVSDDAVLSTMAYWVGENAAITEARPNFTDVKVQVKKLAALIPTSGELLEDSTINLANLIATLVGEQFAQEEDRVAFVGDTGAGDAFNGALTDAGNATVLAANDMDTVTADDLLQMITDTPTGALNGARFLMHRSVFNKIRTLKTTPGDYIYDRPSGTTPGSIWGYPFALSDQMPAFAAGANPDTKFLLFGNFANYYLATRSQMSIAATDQVGFANYQTHFRFIERLGMKLMLPATLTALATAP